MEFYPDDKGGGKSFSHVEGGGGRKRLRVVFLRKLEVLAVLKGGGVSRNVHPLEGGGARKLLPCLQGGRKMFQTHGYPIL